MTLSPTPPAAPDRAPDQAAGSAGAATPRRLVLRGATLGAAATVALAQQPAAEAAVGYRPGHHRGAPLLPAADLHLANRFSYGVTPALTRQVRARGGARAWFEWQLRPTSVPDGAGDALADWWPSLSRSPQDLWSRQVAGTEAGWEVMTDYQRWLLVRRISTERQLLEKMTEFWMNHLHVPVHHDGVFTHRVDYDRVVRAHALGSFSDLLQATIVHPAMSIFLDNAVSTRTHPNENLGRELLEIHTVGRGAYDEDDVKTSARLLTGFRVDMWRTWEATYSTRDHWVGPVDLLGFRHPNADPDGRQAVAGYLDHLAHHPRTAARIARRLAVAFVSDDPSEALVSRLAQAYLDAGTAIVPVLRVLIGSSEFARSVRSKVRDPAEDVVATYRALGVRIARPGGDSDGAANAIAWQATSLGATPCDWPRPDGPPLDSAAWSSPARMLASMDVHWVMSGGWWPRRDTTYRTPAQWMPRRVMRFDTLVDSLCQQLLGQRSTAQILRACCHAADLTPAVRPATRIGPDHPIVRWGFHRILSTILDSPHHLTR